ncbi:armadillo-type protein [Mycena pura]|uniref:Vacuolar protein 8 n=1 Tax=Mycena pura TaxID=153505 RepID=A0AAD6VHR3_9AGAR|nr:armadillo-type protein [Mycena pura]
MDRPATPHSTHSWWSDSNSTGATISLHAAAKPLMKLMYDQQARGLIKRDRGTPLSRTSLEIYSSYLTYKHIFSRTRTLILRELDGRATLEADARSMADFLTSNPHLVAELLECSDSEVRGLTCMILGHLARHNSIMVTVLALDCCVQIVPLDVRVRWSAIHAILALSSWKDGSRAIVSASLLDELPHLLESSDTSARKWACTIVGNVASHQVIPAVLLATLCVRIVSLLSDKDVDIVGSALYALSQITSGSDGIQVVMMVNVLEYIPGLLFSQDATVKTSVFRIIQNLLLSSNPSAKKGTCEMLGNITSSNHDYPFLALLDLKPCVSCLGEKDATIRRAALYALANISRWPGGAEATLDTNVLDKLTGLLDLDDTATQKWMCTLLANLALKCTLISSWTVDNTSELVSYLRTDPQDVNVHRTKIYALSTIASVPNVPLNAVDANMLNRMLDLLDFPDPKIKLQTCDMVGNLASHRSLCSAILESKPCPKLVALLSHEVAGVRQSAAHAMACICRWPEGAEAVVDATALNHVQDMLDLPDSDMRISTCDMLGNMACHRSTGLAILQLIPYRKIVSLLSDQNPRVCRSAVYALWKISGWVHGAEAIVDRCVLTAVPRLLRSTDRETRKWTCEMLGELARHKSPSYALVETKLCKKIISMLMTLQSDSDISVRRAASYALANISCWPEGAAAVLDALPLDRVKKLLNCSDSETKRWMNILEAKAQEREYLKPKPGSGKMARYLCCGRRKEN